MSNQTRTQAETRSYTYTIADVKAVAMAVAGDLEDLVGRCAIDLSHSLGGPSQPPGQRQSRNQRLIQGLTGDFNYLLMSRYLASIAFAFHLDFDGALDGYPLTYDATYLVQERTGAQRATPAPPRKQPLALIKGVPAGTFKIIVQWSTLFSQELSEGERQSCLGGQGLMFRWRPAPRLISDSSGRETARYYSGNFGVARHERSS